MEENKLATQDEVTLRDLILKSREYVREAFRYWYVPAFFVLLIGGYKLYQYYNFIPVYAAKITFSVDEDEGGGSTGLSGVLGQFGLGGIRPTRYNLVKILELSKSRRVIQQTLFNKITIDDKEDYLVNHLLRIYQQEIVLKKEGKDEPRFHFTHDSLFAFDRRENEVMLRVYNFILGPTPKKALLTADYNEDTNIMSLTATTKDEILSLELSKRMFESLSGYYVNKTIEKQAKTFKIVSAKRDSIVGVLRSYEYQLANFRDTHRSLQMRTDQVEEFRLQRQVTALSAMYAEVLKNTEVADFSLRIKTPFIQVIDAPILPLSPIQLSLIRQLLIGVIMGGALGTALVMGRKIILDMFAPTQS